MSAGGCLPHLNRRLILGGTRCHSLWEVYRSITKGRPIGGSLEASAPASAHLLARTQPSTFKASFKSDSQLTHSTNYSRGLHHIRSLASYGDFHHFTKGSPLVDEILPSNRNFHLLILKGGFLVNFQFQKFWPAEAGAGE